MNIKIHNIAKKIGIIILIVYLTVITGSYTANKIFFNPYRDFKTASSTFVILNQLLSPSVTESYLDKNSQESFMSFSYHSQGFRLLKFSYSHNPYEPQNTGKINYRFSKATLEDYNDRLNLNDLTCPQSVFFSSVENQENLLVVSDNNIYEVWVQFKNPVNRKDFSEKYGWLLDNKTSRPEQCGICWIPIKTSDNAEDICLGLAGNLSFHYMNPYNIFAGQDFYRMDLYGREIIFTQALEFLMEHTKETDMFTNTGLWKNAATVNFKERHEYILKNGIQYLGFVAYIKGKDLQTLKNDSIEIVRLNEDK